MRFHYPAGSAATVAVYNKAGYLVARLSDDAGAGELVWDAKHAAPGVYVFRITLAGGARSPLLTLLLSR